MFIGNILFAAVLLPFLIVLREWVLGLVIVVAALIMGWLYTFLIRDIGHLEWHHHAIAAILIPIIVVINFGGMVYLSDRFITELKLTNVQHSPVILGILYGVAFILPYIIDKFFIQRK